MLQINQKTVRITASDTADGVTYSMQYEVTNDALTSVLCSISKTEEHGSPIQVGVIRLQNGKIFTELLEGSDLYVYVGAFEGYVSEIKSKILEKHE